MPSFGRNATFGIGVVLFVLSCYSPNIGEGRYVCGSDGGCPDNFHCASNHRCYQEADARIDMQAAVCNTDASVQQVCSAAPATGQSCNPGCQTGCNGCGWCAVVANGATKCLTETPGTKKIGDICDPSLTSSCSPAACTANPNAIAVAATGSATSPTQPSAGPEPRAASRARCMGTAEHSPLTLCSLVSTCDAVTQKGCDLPLLLLPDGADSSQLSATVLERRPPPHHVRLQIPMRAW